MLEINVFGEISPHQGTDPSGNGDTFSREYLAELLSANPNERDIKLNINSGGGYVHEALAIYDLLRGSGKNIHAHIESSCHSAAIIILLSAPAKNRSANQNCRALIHEVRQYLNTELSAADSATIADTLAMERNEMIKLYVDRTHLSTEEASELIKEEIMHTAEDLLAMGFINKINSYTTNKIKTNMTKKRKGSLGGLINRINRALTPTNFDYHDEAGELLFSTDSDEDTLAVGDAVTLADGETSGAFVLDDGRTVSIEDGVVVSIGDTEEIVEELMTEIEELKEENDELKNLLTEARNAISSSYKPQNRANGARVGASVDGGRKTDVAKEISKNELKENKAHFLNKNIKK